MWNRYMKRQRRINEGLEEYEESDDDDSLGYVWPEQPR